MSAVADWGFPRQGAPTPTVGTQTYYFGNVFPPNCMKLKKNWTGAYIPNAPAPGSAAGLLFLLKSDI